MVFQKNILEFNLLINIIFYITSNFFILYHKITCLALNYQPKKNLLNKFNKLTKHYLLNQMLVIFNLMESFFT